MNIFHKQPYIVHTRGIEWSRRDFGRLRDKAISCEPKTPFHLFPLFSKFETLRQVFEKKTRLRDPQNLTEILQDSDFLPRPFDTPHTII